MLRRVQDRAGYRQVLRKLLQNRLRCREAGPIEALAYFRRRRNRDVATVDDAKAYIEKLRQSGFGLAVTLEEHVLGWGNVVQIPAHTDLYPGWWIFDVWVSPWVRGAGIGEFILREAFERLRQRSVSSVHCLVAAHNHRSLAMCRKVGFRPSSLGLLDEHLRREQSRGNPRRVLLCRQLGVQEQSSV